MFFDAVYDILSYINYIIQGDSRTKKILPILTAVIICIALSSCGGASITGDPVSYTYADSSFSIDLPTAGDDFWSINENSPSSVLDISTSDDTVNIQVQCLSKKQAGQTAGDLAAYKDYAMMNMLGDILADITLEEADAETPDFITNSMAYEFSRSGDVRGMVLFMESSRCYYTYFVMAVGKAYSGNSRVFSDSIMSLQEKTDASAPKASEAPDNE